MKLDANIRGEIRGSLRRAHQRALHSSGYLPRMEEELYRLVDRVTRKDFIKRSKVRREFGRVTYLSKQNNYTTGQYLKLLAQLVEGVATEYQKELLAQKNRKSTN